MVQVHHPQCPFCHTPVQPRESKVACDRCMSWQHEACWDEHGRCATCRWTVRLARTPAPVTGALAPMAGTPGPAELEPSRLSLDPPDPELEAYIRAQIAGVPDPTPAPTRPLPWDCPRCRLPLTPSRYEDTHVQSCHECFGYWLSDLACAEIAVKRDAYFSADERRTVLRWALEEYRGEVRRDLPCPMCQSPLEPTPFKGLLPYRCVDHGVWLDTGDLKRIQILVESSRGRLNKLLRMLQA